MGVYERIEMLRKEHKISQGKLEKELGFSNGSVSKWKSSTTTPERLKKLADYFHVSVEYLITGKEDNVIAKNSVEKTKIICKERKIPISKLEKDLGFSNGYISQLRKGVFPYDRLKKIADYLNVSVEYLGGGWDANAEVKEEKPIDLKDEFNRLEKMLKSGEVTPLYFDGQPVDQESINLLLDQIKISVAFIAKQRKK